MGIKLTRQKKEVFFIRFIYFLNRFPLKSALKLRLYLNLEWIFERLAHEMSFRVFSYEKHPLKNRNYTKQRILKYLKSSHNVLDLGCNNGELSYFIATRAKIVVGVDINKELIANAKIKFKKDNLFFIHAEAYEYLQRCEEKFDVLILLHVLEHIDNPEDFMNKHCKYFKYIYIEAPDFDRSYLDRYRKALNMDLIYTDADHVTEFDRFELNVLINKCKMEIINSEYRFGIQSLWCKTTG